MSERLTIQITAQDGASRVFHAVSGSAQTMGEAVESAGTSGSASIQSLSQELQSLEGEIDAVGTAMVGLGAGIVAALGVPLAMGTKAAWDQVSAVEQATFALREYADEGDNVNAVLQDLTRYAEDASRSGGIFWSQDLYNAAQNLATAGAEVENLSEYVQIMSRSVGTTTTSWNELNQVIGRVVSTGRLTTIEFELLQQAGFRLDESLRNTTVTAEELFAALDQAIPASALAGAADTIEGRLTYLQGAFINLGQAVLGVNEDLTFVEGGLGDQLVNGIDSVTASINNLAPAAASFGEGIGTVVSGVLNVVDAFNALPAPAQEAIATITGITGASTLAAGALLLMVNPAVRVFQALNRLRQSQLVLGGLTAAVNPVTLGITAAAAGAAVLWTSFREGQKVTENLEEGFRSLAQTQDELILSGSDEAAARVKEFSAMMNETLSIIEGQRNNLTNIYPDWADIAAEEGVSPTKWLLDLQLQYEYTSEEAERFAVAQSKLGAALSDPRVNGEALLDTVADLQYQLMAGQITGDEFLVKMEELTLNLGQFREEADAAATGTTGLADAWSLLQGEGENLLDTILNLNTVTEDDSFADRLLKTLGLDASQRGQLDSIIETVRGLNAELDDMPEPGAAQSEWIDWINEEGISQTERTRRVEAANQARREEESTTRMATIAEIAHTTALDAGNAAMGEYAAQQEQAATIAESWNAHLEERNALIEENTARLHAAAGVDDPLSQWNMGEHATEMSMLADATQDAAGALDSVFRVIVSNTDAIGQQVQGVEDWALELINVRGEYGAIDDLLASGAITLQQYNDAQAAQETISAANLAIQEDILAIQAQQAPLIADHTAALSDQMGIVADMPAQQQLIALGWMDATTAGRAMEFQTLAVAAAAGELGANGEQAFTSMITGAAQADPVLKALLIDMGLISEGADGTITVNLDGAEGAMSDMEKLRLTINALIETLGGEIPDLDVEVTGEDDVDSLRTAIENMPSDLDLDVRVNTPDGDLIRNFVSNVTGTDVPALDVEVRPQLPPNASQLLQDSMGGQSVEIEVAPVISTAMDWASGALGGLFGDDDMAVMVDIDANDNASMTLQEVQRMIDDLPDSHTIDIAVTDVGGTHQIAADNLTTLQDRATALDGQTIDIAVSDLGGTHQIAATNLQTLIDRATTLDGINPSIHVLGDATDAMNAINLVQWYDGVTIANPWVYVLGDASDAMNSVTLAQQYDGVTVANPWLYVLGDASDAMSAVSLARQYDGVVLSTSYIDIVTRTSTVSNNRHGGIPGFAHGGTLVPFIGGEAGPEIAHFATGGTALLPGHGLYGAPPNTYISPNNATGPISTVQEGDTYHLHVHGNVYGIDDLAGALETAVAQRRASHGGMS